MKKNVIILLLALVVLIAGGATAYYLLGGQQGAQEPQSASDTTIDDTKDDENKTPAPDFTVYDSEGNSYALSDFRGSPVVVNFWATWCSYCVQEMPYFEAAAAETTGSVHFLMVNTSDTQADAEAFLSEQGFQFPVYFDLDLNAANAYGIYGLPSTYFIDAEGELVASEVGAITEELLWRDLDKLGVTREAS